MQFFAILLFIIGFFTMAAAQQDLEDFIIPLISGLSEQQNSGSHERRDDSGEEQPVQFVVME